MLKKYLYRSRRSWCLFGWSAGNLPRSDQDSTTQSSRLSPDHKASLAARILLADTGFGTLSLVPSYTWQSEVYFDNTERAVISQDSYGLLNLNAQLDFANGFGIEAYISNALDEEYLIDAGNTGDAFGIPTFIPGAPQFYGVRLSKSF